jgi:shikimate dehydrogenase
MTEKKFGLIGHPIAHSLSPALFKAGYDGRYPYELIEGEDFEESYRRFLEGYDGINVTAPFKEPAFAKADILSPECEIIGATNLLVKTPQGVMAFNSDFLGVRMWLEETTAGGLSVLIVGLGGAGKAAAAAAESLGMEVIRMNRTIKDDKTRPLDDFRECFREADIVIYNIPTAIHALNELTDNDFTPGRPKFILEANYKNPSFDEALLERMRQANPLAGYTGGKTWLLYQALTGYELFTGEKPDLANMSEVI